MANVPVVRTSFSRRELARALIMAWKHVVGHLPSKQAAGIVFAHYRLETGDGGFCWNFNIGNCKCTVEMANAGVPYMMLAKTWEIEGGKKVIYQPPHPATWFQAFSSLAEGTTAHLSLLRNKRYKPSWPAVESGDPEEFARALKRQGYYTAPVEDYIPLMVAGHAIWMRDTAFDDAMADVLTTLSAPTEPELPPSSEPTVQVDVPSARHDPLGKVYSPPEFARRRYDNGPGEPDDAA